MLNSILLQAAQNQQGGGGMSMIIMLVAMFAIMYFFMFRPQSKKAKEEKKFREAMKPGDKVMTTTGMIGKLKQIKEKTVVLEIADGVKATFLKEAISNLPVPGEEKKEEKKEEKGSTADNPAGKA